ncbi:GNAT family N-acetyltransferase [Vibrio sp. ZSDE26]|uniref:GNAT family N-acetyltransferase n=1 Tax=Vibrio amylolyticus TaxID=2847292 RepID=A0A9X1XPU2_9VIBR|nr:GNAT family N-acetyltransferase [Vibrio amylolyticus]MCK6264925.1 GNAT family N-acetyltransferase [Vibrio amylolyticus]
MEHIIRCLENTDTSDLAEIYSFQSVTQNTSQVPFLSSEKVASLFSNPDHYTLVAEYDSKVIGHVTLFMTTKVRDRHCSGVGIAIHPDFHGKGVGKSLMIKAIEQADNWLNLVRLELEVHCDNPTAVALYEKLGFEHEGTKRLSTFKHGKYSDMFVMSRIAPNFR